jgi:hypothetical protein
MMRGRRCAAVGALAVALVAGGVHRANAQRVTLTVQVLNDSISAGPNLVVAATGVAPDQQPVGVRIEASRDPSFSAPFYVRTSSVGDTAFTVDRLLPEKSVVYFRTTLLDRNERVLSTVTNQYAVRSWVRLGPPGTRPNDVLFTRRPVFMWSPSLLTLPPGPWVFDLTVLLSETNQPFAFAPGLVDTFFVFEQPLEANTSYRWRLHGRTMSGAGPDEFTVISQTSFSIASSEQPTATLFYQNFPNPFGGAKPFTCFWFDLAHRSRVRLTIYDIRMREVKNIIDGLDLPAGAYGRLGNVALGGCDGRYLWDATDDRGKTVPVGLYFAVFEADGKRESKKIVYRP